MKRVLCLLADGFEEIETVTPVDLLRRAGVEVTLAGVTDIEVTGKCGIRLIADMSLNDVACSDFDALFIPGGPAVKKMRGNETVLGIIRDFEMNGRLVAAICAAPLLLHDAGILAKTRFTAHFSTIEELPLSTGERVVLDGKILTSRGAGTALDFGLELVKQLCDEATRDEVAASIMV